MVPMNCPYRGGLVKAPAWVGWMRAGLAWEAACSSDDKRECRELLETRCKEFETVILPMGVHP